MASRRGYHNGVYSLLVKRTVQVANLSFDDTSDSSSTFLSLSYSRNTLRATFIDLLVFSLFF